MILFVAWGTGGSEMFHEIISHWCLDVDYEVLACSDYAKVKIPSAVVIDEDEVFKYIMEKEPEIVINERSNGVEFQKKVTQFCKDIGLTNIVMLDVFFNNQSYNDRLFGGTYPDYVTAVSKFASRELVNNGFNNGSILKIGNPAFDRLGLISYIPMFPREPKVLFLSQGGKNNINHKEMFGIFQDFYTKLEQEFMHFSIDIKLHPMEEYNRTRWKLDIRDYPSNRVHILDVSNTEDFLTTYLTGYDLLIGKNSTLQVQGHILGIPTIFYDSDIQACFENYTRSIVPLVELAELNYYCHNMQITLSILDSIHNISKKQKETLDISESLRLRH